MPSLKNVLPKYRKHRASGQAVVTLSGVDHYLGPHGTKASKLEYDRLLAEWLANGRRLETPQESLTVAEVIRAYVEHAAKHFKKHGKHTTSYKALRSALRPLRQLYGRTPAIEFGPKRLKALRLKMLERAEVDHQKRRVAKLSRSTINARIATIRRVFRWAAGEELVPPSIPQALSMVAGLQQGRTDAPEAPRVKPVDSATVAATLPKLSSIVSAMVKLQQVTGMRPAEVCLIRPADIDRSGEVWTFTPMTHKTEQHGHHRIIAIGPRGQEILSPFLERSPQAFCFSPAEAENARRTSNHQKRVTAICCGNRPGSNKKRSPKRTPGDRYTPDSYRRAIARACVLAGIPVWGPNRLRHTAATEIRKRFGLDAAQAALGHSKANITQVYAELNLEKAVEVAKEIG